MEILEFERQKLVKQYLHKEEDFENYWFANKSINISHCTTVYIYSQVHENNLHLYIDKYLMYHLMNFMLKGVKSIPNDRYLMEVKT